MARIPKPIGNVRSLSRKPPKLEPLHGIYVYCEGRITEPEYIRAYYTHFCTKKKVVLFPVKVGEGNPKTLVEKCTQKFNELKKSAKRDSYEKNTVLAWVEIEEQYHIEEAIRLAKGIGIEVAISNPCFEVYGLMHETVYDKPLTRFEAQELLASLMPGYHHKHAPRFNWAWCSSKVECAIQHSTLARKRREEEGTSFPKRNPSSDFHRLLNSLNPQDE